MSEELKPCPFCGEWAFAGDKKKEINTWYFVGCANCFAQTAKYPTEEEAIKAWNRRADDEKK